MPAQPMALRFGYGRSIPWEIPKAAPRRGLMKLSGVRADPLAAVRRRTALQAASVQSGLTPAPTVDEVSFLGLGPDDLSPAVQAALTGLLTEVDELRKEVGRLKSRLMEAEDLADRDGLTPILNRRAFMRELHRVLTFSQRYGGPASLVYFDLDGFKAVNDRFGHAAGDVALQTVAERLKANVRESDVVARIGGDEFGVILVQADLSAALAKAASLAAQIEGEPVVCGEWLAPLKVTYGVRQIEPGVSAEQALAEADAQMYARKRGR
jgi:diguanylate cyclase (GGDEF)-like protein